MGDDSSEKVLSSFVGRELRRFLANALKPTRRRRILYFLLLLVVIAVILDAIQNPYSGLFGVVGGAGIAIYMGILLLLVLPPKWSEYLLFRFLAIAWIIIGVVAIVNFLINLILLSTGTK